MSRHAGAASAFAGIVMLGLATSAMAAPDGKSLYGQTCIACHGEDGRGKLPGVPDFTERGGRLEKPDDVLVNHVIDGFQSPGSPMSMPAKGGNPSLSDAEAAAVVRYIREAFSAR